MDTIISAEDSEILRGAQLIRDGEIVAFPTETVYGLGADAMNANAVARIFEAKGRPSDNPLIVHIADTAKLDLVAVDIPDGAYRLFEAFSPGPITVVMKKSADVPPIVSAGLQTVGVRIPSHPVATRFLTAADTPIAAPSANRSKRISPTTAQAVWEDMQGKVPLIIDGGKCSVGIESTVVTLATDTPTILRPGAITPSMIRRVLNSCAEYGRAAVVGSAPAPGMKHTHYRPLCDMALRPVDELLCLYDMYAALGMSPVVLTRDSNVALFGTREVMTIGQTDEEVAASVYDAMRQAEKNHDIILCERVCGSELTDSILNRLEKAANI